LQAKVLHSDASAGVAMRAMPVRPRASLKKLVTAFLHTVEDTYDGRAQPVLLVEVRSLFLDAATRHVVALVEGPGTANVVGLR
jgi:hypothetical protein